MNESKPITLTADEFRILNETITSAINLINTQATRDVDHYTDEKPVFMGVPGLVWNELCKAADVLNRLNERTLTSLR